MTRQSLRLLQLGTLLLVSFLAPRALAQTEPDLVGVVVQLWPDYDRPSMLVIEQGTLSPATPLPATVRLSLPPGADILAVARPVAGSMPALDIDYTVEGDEVTMNLTQPLFLLEYYVPLATDGDERSYEYVWQEDVSVSQLSAAVQQPAAADTFSVAPEPVNVSTDSRGLSVHSLASQAVPAGEPFTVSVSYTSPTGALSAPPLNEPAVSEATTAAPPSGGLFDSFNPLWLLGIFGVAALVGLAFYFGRQQAAATRPRKPAPNRPARPPANRAATPPPANTPPTTPPAATAARYCHQCGAPLVAGDRFCRSCGTAVKTSA